KENNPNPNKMRVSPWLIYGVIILIFLFISFATGGSSFNEPAKIPSSRFNSFLENGDVHRVTIYNKTEAEVYLTEDALKEKTHQAVAKDLLNRPNKGPHYVFDIGNDEIFQNKLEKAISEGK